MVGIPASEMGKGLQSEELVLIQGVIDAYKMCIRDRAYNKAVCLEYRQQYRQAQAELERCV